MLKRNFPLILLFLVFAAMLGVLFNIPRAMPKLAAPFVPEPEEETIGFTGRVVMPSFDDIYILENSAERNLEQLEKFLQGRAAGLHYLAAEHFKNLKKNHKKSKARKSGDSAADDIVVGVRMTLDSLGRFKLNEFVFSNTEDEEFKENLVNHVEYYWRYPKSASGTLEFWIPIRWMENY